jgi:hypothetical protein
MFRRFHEERRFYGLGDSAEKVGLAREGWPAHIMSENKWEHGTVTRPIYKYIGPDNIDKIFLGDGNLTLKYSAPKDFNDPYELFLAANFNMDPEDLAVYAEAIGELPQLPTTCSSKSPIVVPMWAHYAQNHEGFVLEFDEDVLQSAFPNSSFGDVDYSDQPKHDFSDLIQRINHIAKPRYTYLLHRGVFQAAYFTKTACWAYEEERRMIVPMDAVRQIGSMMLLDLPASSVSKIICGARATEDTKNKLRNLAETLACNLFELSIGKSSAVPFLKSENVPYVFAEDGVTEADFYCEECLEPTVKGHDRCSWCSIEDAQRDYAASRNPYRILDHHGILEQYIATMDQAGRRPRR